VFSSSAAAEPAGKVNLEKRVEALERRVEALEAKAQQPSTDLAAALSSARAVPYFREGKLIGLRLFAIRSGSALEALGFCNGDIVEAIDGRKLELEELFSLSKDPAPKSVRLERSNKKCDLISKSDEIPLCDRMACGAASNSISPPEGQVKISRSELSSSLSRSQMRSVPYFRGGQVAGARVFAVKYDGLFARMGLRNGDVILKVDGQSISSSNLLDLLLKELSPGKAERIIELERNAAPLIVKAEFAD